MPDNRIPLKEPWFAAILAYLIPGAGHLYQGRFFKGVLYLICIWGTFFYGMALGDWKTVYSTQQPVANRYGYYSQLLVGLPALPALVQSNRYHNPANESQSTLAAPLTAPFDGVVIRQDSEGELIETPVSGEILLEPVQGDFGGEIGGLLKGTLDGEKVELTLTSMVLEKKVYADPRRTLGGEIIEEKPGFSEVVGRIEGSIPRAFWNWFEVPLEERQLDNLTGRLGKIFELALVYTWIAGLLNILAIWDALEGPAYGYGDEEETRQASAETPQPKEEPSAPKKEQAEDSSSPPPSDDREEKKSTDEDSSAQPTSASESSSSESSSRGESS